MLLTANLVISRLKGDIQIYLFYYGEGLCRNRTRFNIQSVKTYNTTKKEEMNTSGQDLMEIQKMELNYMKVCTIHVIEANFSIHKSTNR